MRLFLTLRGLSTPNLFRNGKSTTSLTMKTLMEPQVMMMSTHLSKGKVRHTFTCSGFKMTLCHLAGKFMPTRRTPGVSTSELLERIVSGYRKRDFDKKLERMGHAELKAEGSDYDDSRPASRSMSPIMSPSRREATLK